jgi:hypothetical protein
MKRVCYATVDTSRAVVALVAPFAALGAATLSLVAKGYSLADYPALISSGEVPWFPQLVGWVCLAAWIVRYFPPAWVALWNGPCIISSDGKDLFLPHGHKISLKSIRAVSLQRGFLRKVAYLDRPQGRIVISLLFVRNSSDPLLRSLAAADKAPF